LIDIAANSRSARFLRAVVSMRHMLNAGMIDYTAQCTKNFSLIVDGQFPAQPTHAVDQKSRLFEHIHKHQKEGGGKIEHDLLHQPSYTLLRIKLDAGENVNAEPGAMVSMSEGVEIETKAKGGLLSGLKRKILGGESFFMNTFKATAAGEVTLAPYLPGDIIHLRLNTAILAQSGAKVFFSKEGFFLLKIEGSGDLYLSSFGAIHEVVLKNGESYTVDNGHIVAFDQSVQYNLKKVGGLKSTFFSGEGLVCRYTGPGRLFIQTRSEDSLVSWLVPLLPKQKSSD
jgi:uncharacterized protein (AIM24 family)